MTSIGEPKLIEISQLLKEVLEDRKKAFEQVIDNEDDFDLIISNLNCAFEESLESYRIFKKFEIAMGDFDSINFSEYEDDNFDKIRDKVIRILFLDKKFREKFDKFQTLMRYFDRINFAEYEEDDPRVYNWSLYTGSEYCGGLMDDDEICQEALEKRGKSDPNIFIGRPLDAEGLELIGWDALERAAINYYLLHPPLIKKGLKIPEHVKKLFAESRWCFVLQQYCAAVALSRTIIELAIKDKYGNDKEKERWAASWCLKNAKDDGIISEDVFLIGNDINKTANKVMHAGKMVEWKNALMVVEKTKDFLEGIYT